MRYLQALQLFVMRTLTVLLQVRTQLKITSVFYECGWKYLFLKQFDFTQILITVFFLFILQMISISSEPYFVRFPAFDQNFVQPLYQ